MPADSSPKHDQILDAAAELFLAGGYGRTSMDAVTRLAGVSKQTLYAHFSGKKELFVAVLHRELAQLPSSHDPLATPVDLEGLRTSLLEFGGRITGTLEGPHTTAVMRVVLAEATHVPEVRDAFRESVPLAMIARLRQLLDDAVTADVIGPIDVDAHAHLFFGALVVHSGLDGIFAAPPTSHDDSPTTSPAQAPPEQPMVDRLVDAFIRGLRPAHPPDGQ